MPKELVDKIICGDALKVLSGFKGNSVDLVLTDPPYFLDKLDNNWDYQIVSNNKNQKVVKSLPAGMKLERSQGLRFYEWYLQVSKQLYRVLKPGGFFFSFSSPRLYHRMACAVEDVGFLIRDCFIWLYTQNQVKAMGLNHFIDKMKVSQEAKKKLKEKLNGWKTPQIKSCFEPIVMAQKPPNKTFLENIIKYNVGLLNTEVKIGDNKYTDNVLVLENINAIIDRYFLLPKPDKKEKGASNVHMTVKPLALCEYIIQLATFSHDAVVLDPFAGSGTTLLAAKKLGRHYIGIDINQEYVNSAKRRLKITYSDVSKEKCGQQNLPLKN